MVATLAICVTILAYAAAGPAPRFDAWRIIGPGGAGGMFLPTVSPTTRTAHRARALRHDRRIYQPGHRPVVADVQPARENFRVRLRSARPQGNLCRQWRSVAQRRHREDLANDLPASIQEDRPTDARRSCRRPLDHRRSAYPGGEARQIAINPADS